MRYFSMILLSVFMVLTGVPVGFADPLSEHHSFTSRDRLFDTFHQSLSLDRDPPLTDEQIAEYKKAFEDYVHHSSLSDDQVFALNRALNNALSSGLNIDFINSYNWDLLLKVITEDYNSRQINFLTKALESETKFLAIYDKTGNDFFLTKAAIEKEKFLSRIDHFAGTGAQEAQNLARQAARSALKDLAREARSQAKTLARQEARMNAQNAAKASSKQIAAEIRREAKQQNAPQAGGNRGKNR